MFPSVRCDLVTRVMRLLNDGGVVVDAAIELADHEECSLDTSSVEGIATGIMMVSTW